LKKPNEKKFALKIREKGTEEHNVKKDDPRWSSIGGEERSSLVSPAKKNTCDPKKRL